MKSIIFLAPPAAGKGTFSNFLIEKYGYQQLSTGDILRKKAKSDEKLKSIMSKGEFVDDDTIIEIVAKEIEKIKDNQPFILDGVPRTLQQARKLDIILNGLKRSDVCVVYIDVDESVLKDRVIGRRVCPKCHRGYNILIDEFKPNIDNICDDCSSPLIQREDDNLKSFQIRLKNYQESTQKVVDYYKQKGNLKIICNNEIDQSKALEKLKEIIHDN